MEQGVPDCCSACLPDEMRSARNDYSFSILRRGPAGGSFSWKMETWSGNRSTGTGRQARAARQQPASPRYAATPVLVCSLLALSCSNKSRELWTPRAGLRGRDGHARLGWAFGSRFGFSSILRFLKEIRFLGNGNRSVPKNSWNRTFRFSVISVRFRF